jgi:nucleoside-diphosphate-sugar epimerase
VVESKKPSSPKERIDEMKTLVTGATGCVGSNLVEELVRKGHGVRALVRPGSDARFLEEQGVETVRGDLADAGSLRTAVRGVDAVFHCAAMVSDWADLEQMRAVNVRGLERLLSASADAGVKRFIYMSSMVVLGMGRQANLDERAPYVLTGDNYNRTKIEAEKLALKFGAGKRLAVTIVRAPYVYGPRDRQMFPRILKYLKNGRYSYISGGENPFTLVYAKNLADGLIRAAEHPKAAGEIYNIADAEPVTRRELIERISGEMGIKKPTRSIPYPLASVLCRLFETGAWMLRLKTPPLLNRFRLKFMYTHLTFDISKARRELGYGPDISFDDAIRATVKWFREQEER